MKNRQILIWQIIFTYVISYYSLNTAYGVKTSWYIAFDFFLMLSGYFLTARALLKKDGVAEKASAWSYTWQKYKNYFPFCLFAFFVAFLLKGIYRGYGIRNFIGEFIRHIPEVFLFYMSGENHSQRYPYNSITWSISVMLIVGFIIWFLLTNYEKVYIGFICPPSVMFIYSYLYRSFGFIGTPWANTEGMFLNPAMLRGVADMNLGIMAYMLNGRFLSQREEDRKRLHLSFEFISDLCFLCGGILIPYMYDSSYYDFLFIGLLFVGIVVGSLCNRDIAMTLREEKILNKWIVIMPALFLNHQVFATAFMKYFPECKVWVYLLWFVFITVYSALSYWAVTRVSKLVVRFLDSEKPAV